MHGSTDYQPQDPPRRGSSSPISSLPLEILAHIFKIGSKDYRDPLNMPVVSASFPHTFPPVLSWWSSIDCDPHRGLRFRLLVSHVCRHWRIVAISTRTLWNVIAINSHIPWSNDIVSLQLERSDPAPLDIYIDWEVFPRVGHRALDSLYSLLVAHVRRWRFVSASGIHREVERFLNVVSRPNISAATQLTTLRLRQVIYHGKYKPMSGALFGGSLPNLTTFFIWGLPVNWGHTWISAASNLRDLTLCATGYHENAQLSWTQFASILRGAPRLEILSLTFFLVDTESLPLVARDAPISVPKLTQFSLTYTDRAKVFTLLHHLYMPALNTLTLNLPSDDYTEFAFQLAGPATSLSSHSDSFGERAPSLLNRLEQLNLIQFECMQDAQEPLYGELSNVTSLSIPPPTGTDTGTGAGTGNRPSGPGFLGLLLPCTLPGQNVMVRVPRLERLYVTRPVDDLRLVRKVVETRRKAGVHIKELYLVHRTNEMTTSIVREEWNKDVAWLRNNVELLGIEDWD